MRKSCNAKGKVTGGKKRNETCYKTGSRPAKLIDALYLIESLIEKGIGFKSIQDGAIDTTTASGELMFNIFSALAQFERRLIQERTHAGLKAARARGRNGGRPKIRDSNPKVQMAKEMHQKKSLPIDAICQSLSISRATFYRYLSL
ncbi:recombinase family protein (plasmid) [Photobacterium damselae subsp. piscicida]|nr:recombinase family protein [Photobacterium damselae]MBE8130591.1 recombinase family protein [Photobacterium damselae subsp. piscicida]MBE8130596.1 recombinase family protein [Photobacterium damselae subsp. piscicida]MBE8130601.1 recombinase family protein [Photobacterium damselae subsp. piscicida]